jgi:hypothetical protein
MERFHIIDDAVTILRVKGVYRQAKMYRRGIDLFAGYGVGFIRLYKDGGTSAPNVSWEGHDGPMTTYDKLGRAQVLP